jgi:hypothetical protein
VSESERGRNKIFKHRHSFYFIRYRSFSIVFPFNFDFIELKKK